MNPAFIVKPRKIEPEHRRTHQKVRKHSRPRGAAGRYVGLQWHEANERIRALEKWERKQARGTGRRGGPRKNRAVGHVGVELYKFMARRAVNNRGRLDDLSYGAIGKILGFARSAIVAAMARLKAHGWMDWRRQYEETGEAGVRGPQVQQAANFFWVTAPIAALLKLGIRLGGAPAPDDFDHARAAGEAENKDHDFAESPLGGSVAALGSLVRERETSKRPESRGMKN